MEKYKIIEGNKLITELLNNDLSKVCKNDLWDIISLKKGFTTVEDYKDEFWTEDVKFHKSWNWLMPVIEKIEDLGYTTNICCTHLGQNMVTMGDGTGRQYSRIVKKSKILAVWLAVVEFIKWYNEENNQI